MPNCFALWLDYCNVFYSHVYTSGCSAITVCWQLLKILKARDHSLLVVSGNQVRTFSAYFNVPADAWWRYAHHMNSLRQVEANEGIRQYCMYSAGWRQHDWMPTSWWTDRYVRYLFRLASQNLEYLSEAPRRIEVPCVQNLATEIKHHANSDCPNLSD